MSTYAESLDLAIDRAYAELSDRSLLIRRTISEHRAGRVPITSGWMGEEIAAIKALTRKYFDLLYQRDGVRLEAEADARRERLASAYEREDGVFSEGFVEACER